MNARIDYSFQNTALLEQALSHSSYINEKGRGKLRSNERLEFLGDAVLDAVISERIFLLYPELDEGELSKMRSTLVCEAMLAEKAREAGLVDLLKMGKGEIMSGANSKDSILCDAFEAVIGAIFLDAGFDAAKGFVLVLFNDDIVRTRKTFKQADAKTFLQELMQAGGNETVTYRLVAEQGPDHDRVFFVEALHCGRSVGEGKGRTKKEAEQSAAQNAIDKMKLSD